MAGLPEPLLKLIASLGKLPGIGPRSAERIALHVVQGDQEIIRALAQALINAREKIQPCQVCGALTEAQPCAICQNPNRDPSLVCVVEKAVDVVSLERGGSFRGRFHVLGGRISPLNGIGPEDLRISQLLKRLSVEPIREIILALPADVEGDATSHYLSKLIGNRVKVSRIAQGLPVGGGLEFADDLTISRAMEGRRDFQ